MLRMAVVLVGCGSSNPDLGHFRHGFLECGLGDRDVTELGRLGLG